MHPSRCADSGIFSLGSPSLDRRAMEYIMKRYPVRTDDVIISGTGIAALAAISSLINMGIASNRITLLVRSEEHIVDDTIDKFVSTVSIYIFIYIYLSIICYKVVSMILVDVVIVVDITINLYMCAVNYVVASQTYINTFYICEYNSIHSFIYSFIYSFITINLFTDHSFIY